MLSLFLTSIFHIIYGLDGAHTPVGAGDFTDALLLRPDGDSFFYVITQFENISNRNGIFLLAIL